MMTMIGERMPDLKEKRAWWENVWLKIILGVFGLVAPLAAIYWGAMEKSSANQTQILVTQRAMVDALVRLNEKVSK
jgi:hypothetical protein